MICTLALKKYVKQLRLLNAKIPKKKILKKCIKKNQNVKSSFFLYKNFQRVFLCNVIIIISI